MRKNGSTTKTKYRRGSDLVYMRLCLDCNGDPITVVDKRFALSKKEVKQFNERIADYAASRIMYYRRGQNIFKQIGMIIFAFYIRHLATFSKFSTEEKNYSPLLNTLVKRQSNYMYSDILLDTIVYIYRLGKNRIDYFEINRRRIHTTSKFFFTVSTK